MNTNSLQLDAPASSPIDLTTALPPAPPQFDQELRRTLSSLAEQPGLGGAMRKNRIGGEPRDREAAAHWLTARLGPSLTADRSIVTNGTQSALQLLLHALIGSGGVLAAEALTYVVLKTIAARLGIGVVGVALDDQGIVPEALDEVCRVHRPKALYCNPTVHNPTTAVMPQKRRLEVIAVARKHGIAVIEDDVLGAVHPEAPPPIAALAPDITWYIMSLSKCYAMGLRLAYVVAPDPTAAQRLVEPVRRLSSWFPNSLCVEIASRWALDGSGRRIAAAVRAEIDARQEMAAEILEMRNARTAPGALHLWLGLPASEPPQHFADLAQRRGVLVRPADLFAVDATARCDHVRISLTGPLSRDELRQGLCTVADLYRDIQRG